MGKMNAFIILVGKPERKKPLGRPRHKWEDNVEMDLDGVDWMHLARDRDR
jgi:hypothetical protein